MNQSDQGAMIKQVRQQYGLSAQQVADIAGVPLRVEYLMELGCPVRSDDVLKVMHALSVLTNEHSKASESRTTIV